MKKRKIIIIGLASTLTIGGISLLAHARDHGRDGSYCDQKEGKAWHHSDSWRSFGHRHNKHHHGGEAGSGLLFHLEKQIKRLDLSKAQREPIYAVLDDNRPVLRNLGSEIADTHQALRQLDLKSENYQQRLSELATKQAELTQKRIVKIGEVKSQVFALLNEQQQADFLKWQEKRRSVK